MTKRIFVSATFVDLERHRKAVRDTIRQMGHEDVAMEYYTAEDLRPLEKCLADVRSSDCYVGLFAFRYGHVPEGYAQSITELEYRAARETGIQCLIFIVSDSHPWPPALWDGYQAEGGKGKEIARLRNELLASHAVDLVTTEEDCAGKVAKALHNWLERARDVVPIVVADDDRSRYLSEIVNNESAAAGLFVDLYCNEFEPPSDIPAGWPDRLIHASFLHVQALLEREHDGEAPAAPSEELNRRLHFREVASRHRRLLLTGRPGAGKTTCLKFMRWRVATLAQNDATAAMPLWIDLANWPETAPDFRSFVSWSRQVEGAPQVPPENFFLLADGLNEIDPDFYEQRLNSISDWLVANPARPIYIATRPSPKRAYSRLALPLVELQPLTSTMIGPFAHSYIGEQASQSLLERIGFQKGAEISMKLAEVVSNPFYLGLLCYLHSSLPEKVPASPSLVSRLFVRTLYERSLQAQAHAVGYEGFVGDLGYLALGVVEGRSGSPFSRSWAQKYLEPKRHAALELATSCGVLVTRADGEVLHFEHQIIQDYLAAEFFLANNDQLSRLAGVPAFRNGDRAPARWDAVFDVIVELDRSSNVMKYMVDIDPILVADALSASSGLSSTRRTWTI